jgi:hypothetical protein
VSNVFVVTSHLPTILACARALARSGLVHRHADCPGASAANGC